MKPQVEFTTRIFGSHVITKISNVICEDGKQRMIDVSFPDTFFSMPGRTQCNGKTVTGFVTKKDDKYYFYSTGKNKINGKIIQEN